ncbi:hypothetical protein ES702_06796 [subsurface metagenome]
MKTRYWVVILVVVAIIFIGIVLFVCDFFPDSCFSGGKYRGVSQYEIFRDLLTIILAISTITLAVLGVVIYKLIYLIFERHMKEKIEEKIEEVDFEVRKKVKREVGSELDKRIEKVDTRIEQVDSKATRRTERETDKILTGFYLELSIIYWRQYEKHYKEGKVVISKNEKNFLDLAIETGEKALQKSHGLDKKEFEKLICDVKNNLAYHLAVRDLPDDSPRAITLAEYIYKRVPRFDYRDVWIWVETYAFVLSIMGSKDQKEEAQGLIRGLVRREEILDKYKKYLKTKYGQFL